MQTGKHRVLVIEPAEIWPLHISKKTVIQGSFNAFLAAIRRLPNLFSSPEYEVVWSFLSVNADVHIVYQSGCTEGNRTRRIHVYSETYWKVNWLKPLRGLARYIRGSQDRWAGKTDRSLRMGAVAAVHRWIFLFLRVNSLLLGRVFRWLSQAHPDYGE